MMHSLEFKITEVKQFGEISLFENKSVTALAVITKSKSIFNFANTFIYKLKKLFNYNKLRNGKDELF